MIRAIFMDIDNTIFSFDGFVRNALEEGLPQFGIAEYREGMDKIFHRVNNELWCCLERGELDYKQLYACRFNCIFDAMGVVGDGPKFEKYFREKLFDSAVIMEGAEDIIKYLSSKYLLCAASNGPFGQQKNRLLKGGLLPYFNYLFISEDLGASKPSSEFYDRAFERLRKDGINIRPDECTMIGDSVTSDMAGGIAYGMKTIFYDVYQRGNGIENIDHTVSQLAEIRNIL